MRDVRCTSVPVYYVYGVNLVWHNVTSSIIDAKAQPQAAHSRYTLVASSEVGRLFVKSPRASPRCLCASGTAHVALPGQCGTAHTRPHDISQPDRRHLRCPAGRVTLAIWAGVTLSVG
jgi:hypothetical protein